MIYRRADSRTPFVITSLAIYDDERLLDGEIAVLTYLLSRPRNWEAQAAQLCARFRWGREKLRRVMRTLEACGYVRREQLRDPETGAFLPIRTMVYDTPETPSLDYAQPAPARARADCGADDQQDGDDRDEDGGADAPADLDDERESHARDAWAGAEPCAPPGASKTVVRKTSDWIPGPPSAAHRQMVERKITNKDINKYPYPLNPPSRQNREPQGLSAQGLSAQSRSDDAPDAGSSGPSPAAAPSHGLPRGAVEPSHANSQPAAADPFWTPAIAAGFEALVALWPAGTSGDLDRARNAWGRLDDAGRALAARWAGEVLAHAGRSNRKPPSLRTYLRGGWADWEAGKLRPPPKLIFVRRGTDAFAAWEAVMRDRIGHGRASWRLFATERRENGRVEFGTWRATLWPQEADGYVRSRHHPDVLRGGAGAREGPPAADDDFVAV